MIQFLVTGVCDRLVLCDTIVFATLVFMPMLASVVYYRCVIPLDDMCVIPLDV